MGGGMALNQLLVQMDGVDEPPFMRKFFTKRFNTFLDATYIVPQTHRQRCACACRPPKPRPEQVYFIGATNVPIDALDPALIRPGRMGRHIWFRTPTKDDRKDIFDLYLGKVDHDPDLDTDRAPRRARPHHQRLLAGDDRAGLLDGADLRALRRARTEFDWRRHRRGDDDDRVGHRRQGIDYVAGGDARGRDPRGRPRGRQPRLHAGRRCPRACRSACAAARSATTRRSRRRSASPRWRHEEVGKLVWTLGAMAAEHVFYGENSTGVGGDVQSATRARRRWMVGMCGMGPEPIDLDRADFADEEEREEAEERSWSASSASAMQIMNRARGGNAMTGDPIAAVLRTPPSSAPPRRSSARPT